MNSRRDSGRGEIQLDGERSRTMQRIGVTGASGFIGGALVAALRQRGDFVRAFVRNPSVARLPGGTQVLQLDLMRDRSDADASAFEGLDAVVHLCGEKVAARWTAEKKKRIHDSRQVTTRNLVAALRRCSPPPPALVCASASGYYGSRGDEPLTEDSPPGSDFLAQVCVDWEREAQKATAFGTRVVCARQAPVMGRGGGALEAMLPPFRFGIGGPLGSGRQWWPWIHLDDDVALLLFAIDREDLHGPINAVSPDLATNARFSQALGHALRRPSLAFVPGPALELILGEFAGALLSSQLILPARAQDLGFTFRYASLDHALLDLVDPNGHRAPGTQRFQMVDKVAAAPQHVFAFLSDAANLTKLVPPSLRFRMLTPLPIEMRRGATIEYELRVWGTPLRWKTLVTSWQPGIRFADVQVRGPYQLWRHQHEFGVAGGAAVVQDTIDYALPFAPLSNFALPTVRADLQKIFDYRRAQIRRLLM